MDKGERTKASLLLTTADLLQRQGLRATGINQILAESGAPKGSLYYHFPGGKEELACAALRTSAEKWREDLQQFMEKSSSPCEAVFAACKTLGHRLKKSSFRLGCPIATVSLEIHEEEQALLDVCDEHFVAWEAYLTELLLRDGGQKPDARRWAVMVLSSIEGALLLSRARRDTQPLRQAGTLLRSQLAARAHDLRTSATPLTASGDASS